MSGIWLRSGIFLPPHHANEEDPTLALRRDIKLLEWLDELGYEEAWIGEHHSGGFEIISSPELMIAAAAERTRRIRLGTGVVSLSYHNPLTVAGRIVQLDHMTMGRTMFGAGPGSLIWDALMQGIDPATTRDRLAISLDVIIRLFRGETITLKTDWFTLQNANLHLLPYTRPYPEIVVASSKTPSGGRLAGQFGVGMICVAASSNEGYDALSDNWKLANDMAAKHGHTMDREKLRLVAPIHLAETRERARENMKFGLKKWVDYHFCNTPRTKDRYDKLSSEMDDPCEIVTKMWGGVIGTPDDAIDLIERLQAKQGEFGCFLQMAHNWADWEETKRSYELYARYVVPHFRKSNVTRVGSLERYRAGAADIRAGQEAAIARSFEKFGSAKPRD